MATNPQSTTPEVQTQAVEPATSPPAPAPQKADSPRLIRVAAKWAAVALALILLGALLVALLFQMQVGQDDLLRWQAMSAGIKRWGLFVQALLLATVIYRWRSMVDWGARRQIVKAHEYDRVLALRWHAALVFVAYLILVPIGPTTLWRYLFQ